MQTNRQTLAERIKALLAKTVERGCTEAEALLAAEKAQELLQLYQMSLSDLDLEAEGVTFTRRDTSYHKRYKGLTLDAVRHLHFGVAAFTDCEATTNSTLGDSVTGLRSDVEFYHWLHDALCNFVMRASQVYALDATSRRDLHDFINTCALRIKTRLRDEVDKRKNRDHDNRTANALVVSKRGLIFKEMQNQGINCMGSWSGKGGGHAAGRAAGDRAGFGKPIHSQVAGRLSYGGK